MRLLSTLLLSLSCLLAAAQSIEYTVSMPEPHAHYFEVEMLIRDAGSRPLEVKMPVWAPGSYLVREFAKSVESVTASNDGSNGISQGLKVDKIDKNTWRIEGSKANPIVVKYRVYANELSVRTTYLDADHGYINGTSLFMYLADKKNIQHTVHIKPFKDWKKVSTSLKPAQGSSGWSFAADNYDYFVDCPIEIGNHSEFEFTAAGVKHRVAMFGEGNYNEEYLKRDMAKVVEACTDVFGQNPNEEYLFIVHNLERGSGGLEHTNSTSLQVSRWNYQPENKYMGFLSLVAHEYFHLWNVKRIRPLELGPFDYDNEVYTPLLWVMEGFTSYYDEYLMRRAGFYNDDRILGKLAGSMGSIENQPGNDVQPVAHSSFDAWIKAYRPNENSYNTTISYYTKGSMVALALDLEIRNNTKGKKSLDDLLQHLYSEFYEKKDRGFTPEEFKSAAEKIAGKKLDQFFADYVNGTKPIDFDTYLGYAGLKRVNINGASNEPWLGMRTKEEPDGRFTISSVVRGTPSYEGGLNAGDEILAFEGYRVRTDNYLDELVQMHKVGDKVTVTVARDGIVRDIEVALQGKDTVRYQIVKVDNPSAAQKKVYDGWMIP